MLPYLHIKQKTSLAESAEAQGYSYQHWCNFGRFGKIQAEQSQTGSNETNRLQRLKQNRPENLSRSSTKHER